MVDTGTDSTPTLNSPAEDIFHVSAPLADALVLPEAGRYWFGIHEGDVGEPNDATAMHWQGAGTPQGLGSYFFGDGIGLTNLFGPFDSERAFVLNGHTVPEPAPIGLIVAGLAALAWQRRSALRVRESIWGLAKATRH